MANVEDSNALFLDENSKRKRGSSVLGSQRETQPNVNTSPPKKNRKQDEEDSAIVSNIRKKVEESRIDDEQSLVSDSNSKDSTIGVNISGSISISEHNPGQSLEKVSTAAKNGEENSYGSSPPKRQKIFGSAFGASASASSPFGAVQDFRSSPLPDNISTNNHHFKSTKVEKGFSMSNSLQSPFGKAGEEKSSKESLSDTSPLLGVTSQASGSISSFSPMPDEKPKTALGAFTSSASPFSSVMTNSSKAFGTFGSKYSGATFGSLAQAQGGDEEEKPRVSWLSNASKTGKKDKPPVENDDEEDEQIEETNRIGEEEGKKDFGTVESFQKPNLQLKEQEVVTGEENEDTLHSIKCKLFAIIDDQWKERGTGTLRLNRAKADNLDAKDGNNRPCRLVMRADTIFRLILNIRLHPGMPCLLQQEKFIRIVGIENGKPQQFAIRAANPSLAKEMHDKLKENIPPLDDETEQ